MNNQSNYVDPNILTRKFVRTGTIVRIAALGIAYLALIAMSL